MVLKKLDLSDEGQTECKSQTSFLSSLGLETSKSTPSAIFRNQLNQLQTSKKIAAFVKCSSYQKAVMTEESSLFDIDITSPLGQRIFQRYKCKDKSLTSKAIDSYCNGLPIKERSLRSTSNFGEIIRLYQRFSVLQNFVVTFLLFCMNVSRLRTMEDNTCDV